MPRVRHENSIDSVPLHMSACGDPGSPGEGRDEGDGIGCNRGDAEKERGGEREREGEVRRRCNNGAMGRLSWGSLCLVCGLALCASAPLIAIVDLLAAAFESYPRKQFLQSPEVAVEKTRRVVAYVALHRVAAQAAVRDPRFWGCNEAYCIRSNGLFVSFFSFRPDTSCSRIQFLPH